MIEKGKLLTILQRVLPEDINAEISVLIECLRSTLIQDNSINEATENHNVQVQVKAEQGGRIGLYTSNNLTISGLREALSQARENAAYGRHSPLILTGSSGYRDIMLKFEATTKQSPESRMKLLEPIIDIAAKTNLNINGALSANSGQYAVVNTSGLAAWTQASLAQFRASVNSIEGSGTGHAFACDRDVDNLDFLGPFLEAVAKCQASVNQQPLSSGEYTVILESAAVADLMSVVAPMVFGGRAYLEGHSPASKIGSKIFGDNVTIWDDGLDPRGISIPFDFEGVPKQRLNLVTKGVFQNIALDNQTAADLNMACTGHASLPWNNLGPKPNHIFMEPGNAMLDDMIASTKRGILVSRLRNLVVLDPRMGIVTGSTGNGTLLVEDGKLTAALPNLRFVQNMVRAFNRVEMIGDETRLFGELWCSSRVPSMKFNKFSIIGSSTGQV